MRYLSEASRAADRVAVIQSNFELLEVAAFEHRPTDDNAIVGPPTAGQYLLHEKWIDSLGAVFRCTTPGGVGVFVFRQIAAAVVTTAERPAAPPDNYWIVDTDEHFKGYYWSEGGAAWVAV